MQQLLRITTQYDQEQDRFKLTGELESGAIVQVWITQRLMLRLLPHLFAWISKQEDATGQSPQAFSQQLCSAPLVKQQAVHEAQDMQTWLASEIDIKPSSAAFVMNFKSTGNLSAQLQLNAGQLRPWLNILHSHWAVAQWEMAVWDKKLHTNFEDSKKRELNQYH